MIPTARIPGLETVGEDGAVDLEKAHHAPGGVFEDVAMQEPSAAGGGGGDFAVGEDLPFPTGVVGSEDQAGDAPTASRDCSGAAHEEDRVFVLDEIFGNDLIVARVVEVDQFGLEVLKEELKRSDPIYYESVDLSNHVRIIRALEVIKLSGEKYSSQRSTTRSDRHDVLWLGLKFKDRAKHYELINNRVYKMIDAGLLDEVTALYNKYGPSKTLLNTIGYGEIIEHLEEKISLDEAIALIQKKTRNYAKRQLTWFNKNQRINWFYCEELFSL